MALRTAAATIAKRVALAAGPQVRVTGHKCCGIFFGAALDLLGALKAVVLSNERRGERVSTMVGGERVTRGSIIKCSGVSKYLMIKGFIRYNSDLRSAKFPCIGSVYYYRLLFQGVMATSTTRHVFVRERGDIVNQFLS